MFLHSSAVNNTPLLRHLYRYTVPRAITAGAAYITWSHGTSPRKTGRSANGISSYSPPDYISLLQASANDILYRRHAAACPHAHIRIQPKLGIRNRTHNHVHKMWQTDRCPGSFWSNANAEHILMECDDQSVCKSISGHGGTGTLLPNAAHRYSTQRLYVSLHSEGLCSARSSAARQDDSCSCS